MTPLVLTEDKTCKPSDLKVASGKFIVDTAISILLYLFDLFWHSCTSSSWHFIAFSGYDMIFPHKGRGTAIVCLLQAQEANRKHHETRFSPCTNAMPTVNLEKG